MLFIARMSLGARSFATLATLLASATVSHADSQPTSSSPHESQQTSAIVGGTDVPLGRWPDAVAIFGTAGSCTGTLIAPDLVLTAGHCAAINPTHIVANTVDYSKAGGIHINVARTTAYPNWKESYDVAVLELVAPIQGIEPRKLGMSCSFASFTSSTAVHLVGFGATSVDGTQTNSKLLEAMTNVTDPLCMGGRGCKSVLAPGGEFVAGGSGTADSCFGDSGGPVYLDTANGPVAIASVSRGVDGSTTACGGGGIYVRTDKVVDWIEETTGRTVAKDDCAGEDYAANEPNVDGKPDEVGCNAGGTSGLGSLLLLAGGVIFVRRRRPGQARQRHAQTNQIREVERDRRRSGETGEFAVGRATNRRRDRGATNQDRYVERERQQRLERLSSPGLQWGETMLDHLAARAAQ